jgi:hypothetical protein
MWYIFFIILLLNACYINISYLFVLIYSIEIIIKYYINCNLIYIVILSNRPGLFLRLISRLSTILLHLEMSGFRLFFLTCMVAYELVWSLTNFYGCLRTCMVSIINHVNHTECQCLSIHVFCHCAKVKMGTSSGSGTVYPSGGFQWRLFCWIFSFLCSIMQIIVLPFVHFLVVTVLSVLPFMAFDYLYGIFKLSLSLWNTARYIAPVMTPRLNSYVLFLVITVPRFPHSWHTTGFRHE